MCICSIKLDQFNFIIFFVFLLFWSILIERKGIILSPNYVYESIIKQRPNCLKIIKHDSKSFKDIISSFKNS